MKNSPKKQLIKMTYSIVTKFALVFEVFKIVKAMCKVGNKLAAACEEMNV